MPHDVKRLIAELTAPEAALRAAAAEALAQLGADASPAAVPLVRAMADQDEAVREWATSALEGLEKPDVADAPALADLLTHATGDVGYWAATLLGRMRNGAAPAAHALAAAVEGNPAIQVRQRAVWALGQIGLRSQPVIEALSRASAAADRRLARLASAALAQLEVER